QLNFVGYANPRADQLMQRIRREYDDARQTAMARELHRLIAHDQPYTFLYVRRSLVLLDGKIVREVRGPGGTPQYLPFEPNRLGPLNVPLKGGPQAAGPVAPAVPTRAERGVDRAPVPPPGVLAQAVEPVPDLRGLLPRHPPRAGGAEPDRSLESPVHEGAA